MGLNLRPVPHLDAGDIRGDERIAVDVGVYGNLLGFRGVSPFGPWAFPETGRTRKAQSTSRVQAALTNVSGRFIVALL
jgi:hypothetical protein